MAEVAGDAAYLANPSDPNKIATGIEQSVSDDALVCDLFEAGERRATSFTWERTTEQTVDICERTVDE